MTAAGATSSALTYGGGPNGVARSGNGQCLPPMPRVGGYAIERRVGRGRMSTVYLARDLRRDGEVALKLMNAEHAADPARVSLFQAEFAIPLRIRNKHVIHVFDQCIGREHVYIAMEYADGGDVAGAIRRGLAASEAVSWLSQAAVALAEVHGRGFVHCDVKPANLLLRSNGELVLADFGLARRVGAVSSALPGTVIGTPCYAAPEQTQGAPALPAGDVYSLGVVFYEMLCGAPPFAGVTAMELQCQHLMAAVPRLPVQLSRFQRLVDSMLEKSPQRRLTDGAAVLDQIDDFKSPYPGLNGANAGASRY